MANEHKREALWITRLKLFARSFKQNWALFKERKIAIFGLSVIIFFAVFGAIFPLYVKTMKKIYVGKTYHFAESIYNLYNKELLPSLNDAIKSGNGINYRIEKMQIEQKIDSEMKKLFKSHKMAEENEFADMVKSLLSEKYFDFDTRNGIYLSISDIFSNVDSISEDNLDELTNKITSYFFRDKISQFINEFGEEEKASIAWNFIDGDKLKETLLYTAKTMPDYFITVAQGYNLSISKEDLQKDPENYVKEIISYSKYNILPIADFTYDAIDMDKIRKTLRENNAFYTDLALLMKDVIEAYIGDTLTQEVLSKQKDKIIDIIVENIDIDLLSTAYLETKIVNEFSGYSGSLRDYLADIMRKHIKKSAIDDLGFDSERKLQSMNNTMNYYKETFYKFLGLSEEFKKFKKDFNAGNIEAAKKDLKEVQETLKQLSNLRKTAAITSNWVENLKGGNAGYGKMGLDFGSIDAQVSSYLKKSSDAFFDDLMNLAREITDFLNTMNERSIEDAYKVTREAYQDMENGREINVEEVEKALNIKVGEKTLLQEDSRLYKQFKEKEKVLEDLSKRIVIYDIYYLADFFSKKLQETFGKSDIVTKMQNASKHFANLINSSKDFDLEKELESFKSLVAESRDNIMDVPLEKIALSEYNIAMIDLLIKSHEDFQKEIKEVLKAHVGKKPSDDLYNKLIDVAVKFDLKEIAESFYFSSLPYDPVTGNDGLYNNPAPPSVLHPLGTDPLGRDIMAEMMYSTPREFVLGITAALITVIIGTIIGATAAYYGGAIDTFFMRVADIVMLFPSLALLMVLSAFIELTLFRLALIMGIISGFGSITIVLKSQALTVKVRPFIEAAKSAGASDRYIISKHIIPNILPLSFLYMMFSVTSAIFSEATLSFFGLVQLKMSWGIILHTAQSQGYLIGSNIGTFWWLWVPPGAAITLICSAFYFLGRGLEEIVNPRLRSR